MDYFLYFLLLTIILLVVLYFFFRKKNPLSPKERNNFVIILNKTIKWKDKRHTIIDLDILFDKILKSYGYKWSLWEKMRKIKDWFVNTNNIWYAHKIRNKLVHEIWYQVADREYKKIINYYWVEISNLLK